MGENQIKVYESYDVPGEDRPVGFYRINGKAYPSVTSLISNTSDKSGIEEWKRRIGYDKANRIVERSTNRGHYLHEMLELSLTKKLYTLEELEPHLSKQFKDYEDRDALMSAQSMFNKVVNYGLKDYVKEVLLMEEKQYVDLVTKSGDMFGYVCKPDLYIKDVNNQYVLLDWKGSNKPKKDDWVEDYKLQIAAYYYDLQYKRKVQVDCAKILIVDEVSKKPNVFTLNKKELKYWLGEFYKRLKYYHEVSIPELQKNYEKKESVRLNDYLKVERVGDYFTFIKTGFEGDVYETDILLNGKFISKPQLKWTIEGHTHLSVLDIAKLYLSGEVDKKNIQN